MSTFSIRPVAPDDRPWIVSLLTEWWERPEIATRGRVHTADRPLRDEIEMGMLL